VNDVLRRIVERKRAHLAVCKRRVSEAARRGVARERAALEPRSLAAALRADQAAPRVIAEFKRRSPSRGEIRPGADPAEIARAYESGGAAAMSVLTDVDFFGGSDVDLVAARHACGLPVLRKDFTIDAYQIIEAAALGAGAVLLIVRILDDGLLRELLAIAAEAGLDALVEVHAAEEVDRALAAGAAIIGVNNRDLDTFAVSLETSVALRPRIPEGVITVAESGIHTRTDVARLRDAGFDGLLVGEALMAAPDPGAALRALTGVEQEERR